MLATDGVQIIGLGVVVFSLLISVAGAFLVMSRTKGLGDSVGLLQEANEGLRGIIEDEKQARINDNRECDRKLHEQEVVYTSKIGLLEGQIQVLTGDIAERIAAAAVLAARRVNEDDNE